MGKKNYNIIILLMVSCFVMLGCFNNLSSDVGESIMAKEDLKKTKKINIKDANSTEIIKAISNKEEINKIVDIITSGKIIEDDEYIVYIGPSYTLEMIDKKGNVFETVSLFTPYGVSKFIELNQLNELYYVDVDKILTIFNLNHQEVLHF